MTTTLAEDVRAYEALRERSLQTYLGPSQAEGCPRQAWYKTHGVEPSDEQDAKTGAAAGTALHEYLAKMRGRLYPWLQHEVKVPLPWVDDPDAHGSLDEYDPQREHLDDWKSVPDERMLDWRMTRGVEPGHRSQTLIYTLLATRHLDLSVKTCGIRYIERARWNEWAVTWDYDEAEAQAALNRFVGLSVTVEMATTPEMVERGRKGPGLDPLCDRCDWCSDCWGTPPRGRRAQWVPADDPIVEALAEERFMAARDEKDAEARRKAADAALFGLKGVYGAWKVTTVADGLPGSKVDEAAVRADYAAREVPVPEKVTAGRSGYVKVSPAR